MNLQPLTRAENLQALLATVIYAQGSWMSAARQVQCLIGGWHRYTPSQVRSRHPGFVSPDEWICDESDGGRGSTVSMERPSIATCPM